MTTLPPLFYLCEVDMDPLSAAVQSRGMVLFVLIALIALSVLSWVVIGSRLWALRQLREGTTAFRGEFAKFTDLKDAATALAAKYRTLPHVRLLAAVLKELDALERSGPLREHDVEAIAPGSSRRESAREVLDEKRTPYTYKPNPTEDRWSDYYDDRFYIRPTDFPAWRAAVQGHLGAGFLRGSGNCEAHFS